MRISCSDSAHGEYLPFSNAGQQSVNFLRRRVACAASTDEAFAAEAEPLDDRGGIKVSVRNENAAVGQPARHFRRRYAAHCERDGRGSRRIGWRTIERNAVH